MSKTKYNYTKRFINLILNKQENKYQNLDLIGTRMLPHVLPGHVGNKMGHHSQIAHYTRHYTPITCRMCLDVHACSRSQPTRSRASPFMSRSLLTCECNQKGWRRHNQSGWTDYGSKWVQILFWKVIRFNFGSRLWNLRCQQTPKNPTIELDSIIVRKPAMEQPDLSIVITPIWHHNSHLWNRTMVS